MNTGVHAMQEQLAQQYAAAAAMLMQQQQQQQPGAHAAVQTAARRDAQPDITATDNANLPGFGGSCGSLPPVSPADVGAWWLDDSTLHFMAKFHRLDEPLVLTVDAAEPFTLSFAEVRH